MKSLGSYTLGDQYVSPNRRLSNMLTQKGSKGGPSNSWQETMGRIAQQLAGAYIGYKDTQNKNKAFDAQTGLEPDSYSQQPTMNDQDIMGSPAVQKILQKPNDAERMQNPNIQNNMKAIGYEQDQINQAEGMNQGINDKLGSYKNPADAQREIDFNNQSIAQANQNIDSYGDQFNRTMGNIRGRELTDDQRAERVGEELIGQRNASMEDTLNQKMNPRDYSMQQLRGLENNPYAKRILAQMMMQNADRDYASGLAKTARERELADIQSGRDYTSEENRLNREGKIAAVNAKPLVPGRDIPLPKNVQKQRIQQRKAGRSFVSPLDQEKINKLQKENENYLTPAQKKVDEVFAKDYSANYVSGGAADARKSLSQLTDVIGRLELGTENLSGPVMGNMPDAYNNLMNPNMVDVKETISEVVQRNLRVILGAAFTAKEGEGLIARAYNPALDEKINAKRVRRLMTAMEQALDAKDKAAQYYEDNGTMNGFKGTANFSMSDFDNVLDPDKNKGRRAGEPNNGGPLSPDKKKRLEELRSKARGQ